MAKGADEVKARINTQVEGEPARILLELKKRGLVVSNTDAVIQGILALHEKVLQRDLALARLNSVKEGRNDIELELP
jgi:hypothetical protein